MKVAVVGAGGHGKVVADTVRAAGEHELVGFLDDDPRLARADVGGHPVLGRSGDWRRLGADALVVGIGDNRRRRIVWDELEAAGATFVTVLHPRATVAPRVTLGRGVVVVAGCVVNVDTVIGDDVVLNTSCSVDHDCTIGAHVHLGPGVRLAGGVHVDEGAFVGAGAVVIPNVRIGEWAVVGAGAVVLHDVASRRTVAGVPAREL